MSGRLRERMEERLPRRLEELSNLYGVSGDEGRVRRYLKDRLAGLEGLTMKTDTMGSLIVHRRGDGPRVMVCAHMDEVGSVSYTHLAVSCEKLRGAASGR